MIDEKVLLFLVILAFIPVIGIWLKNWKDKQGDKKYWKEAKNGFKKEKKPKTKISKASSNLSSSKKLTTYLANNYKKVLF